MLPSQKEMMEELVAGFQVIKYMMGQDEELKEVMKNGDVEVTILGFGEKKGSVNVGW